MSCSDPHCPLPACCRSFTLFPSRAKIQLPSGRPRTFLDRRYLPYWAWAIERTMTIVRPSIVSSLSELWHDCMYGRMGKLPGLIDRRRVVRCGSWIINSVQKPPSNPGSNPGCRERESGRERACEPVYGSTSVVFGQLHCAVAFRHRR